MATIQIEVPDDAFSALQQSPREFAREMRFAAAVFFVLMGKKQGQIASARSLLYSMRKAGMYLSNKVLNKALALVNE